SRSITTPVNGSRRMAGMVWTTAKVPSAILECVACRTYHATAVEFMPLPSMEITLAANTKRSDLFCKIERMSYSTQSPSGSSSERNCFCVCLGTEHRIQMVEPDM